MSNIKEHIIGAARVELFDANTPGMVDWINAQTDHATKRISLSGDELTRALLEAAKVGVIDALATIMNTPGMSLRTNLSRSVARVIDELSTTTIKPKQRTYQPEVTEAHIR